MTQFTRIRLIMGLEIAIIQRTDKKCTEAQVKELTKDEVVLRLLMRARSAIRKQNFRNALVELGKLPVGVHLYFKVPTVIEIGTTDISGLYRGISQTITEYAKKTLGVYPSREALELWFLTDSYGDVPEVTDLFHGVYIAGLKRKEHDRKEYLGSVETQYKMYAYLYKRKGWNPANVQKLLKEDAEHILNVKADSLRKIHASNDKINIYPIYVDCDNVGLFSVLALVDSLLRKKMKIQLYLFYDSMTNLGLWRGVTQYLKHTEGVDVLHIDVQRIHHEKSIVDMAICTQVCKNVYERGITQGLLLSSDSDFGGMLEQMPPNILVGYTVNHVSPRYVEWLGARGVDITCFDTVGAWTEYWEKCTIYAVLRYAYTTPILCWHVTKCQKALEDRLYAELSFTWKEPELLGLIQKALNRVEISIKDECVRYGKMYCNEA